MKQKQEQQMVGLTELLKIQREHLETMAGSFEEFARSLNYLPEEEEAYETRESKMQKMMVLEHRRILEWQLKSFANCFTQIASESGKILFFQNCAYQNVVTSLRENGIILKNGYMMQTRNGVRYFFEMAVTKRCRMELSDVEGLLSVALDKALECNGRKDFWGDLLPHTYEFEEKAKYHMMTGFARAIKEGENVSGDNGSILERKDHHSFLLLADGVGSGQAAARESGATLEMVESILQAGNELGEAMHLTGSALSLIETELHYPSFDACCIQLENGRAVFYKAGGICSFVKKGDEVRLVKGGGTPLGAFPELQLETSDYELEDDCYIIMITDGVLENMNVENPEELLLHDIHLITLKNPGEIASEILQFAILQSGGKVRDDMMVCVAGIWEV